jgi:transposase-like protein
VQSDKSGCLNNQMKFLTSLWRRIVKSRSTQIQLMANSDITSQKNGLVCPKCSSDLYSISGNGAGMQLYVCRNCAYQGGLGLKKNQMPYKNIPLW